MLKVGGIYSSKSQLDPYYMIVLKVIDNIVYVYTIYLNSNQIASNYNVQTVLRIELKYEIDYNYVFLLNDSQFYKKIDEYLGQIDSQLMIELLESIDFESAEI